MPTRVFFVFPPQVHLLDVNGPAHIFYEARELGADLVLHYLSLTGAAEATSSAGLVFGQLEPFAAYELGAADYVFIPGPEKHVIDEAAHAPWGRAFQAWLRAQHARGAKLCSVCTGAYLLAQSGLLAGRQCTTHWKYLADFARQFPAALLRKNRLFVQDGALYSSAGVASGIDLALYIVEAAFGSALAAQVAKEVVVYLRRTPDDPQLSVFLQYRNHVDDRVHQVQDLVAQHLSEGLTIEALAAAVCMSPRNLTRLFKKTAGVTIGEYQDQLRLERAVTLLAEGMKVEAVAQRSGYSRANQLRELLKKRLGRRPGELLLAV